MIPFIEQHHDPQVPPPYAFPGVSIQSFRLRADIARLRSLCDKLLNIGTLAQRGFEYRPTHPFVDLEILHYPRMQSLTPPFSERGHTAQHELYFRLLVTKFELHGFLLIPTEAAVFVPFIAVDNAWSVISGREVIGFPKLMASFELAGDPASPYPVTVRTDVYEPYDPSTPLRHAPLVRIEAAAPTGAPASLAGFTSWPWGVLELAGIDAAAQPLLQAASAAPVGFPTVQLKQFRDAERHDLACYQALVRSEFKVTRMEPPQPLPAAEISIPAYASIAVAEALGLQQGGPIRPLLQYRVACDLEFGAVRNLYVRRS